MIILEICAYESISSKYFIGNSYDMVALQKERNYLNNPKHVSNSRLGM